MTDKVNSQITDAVTQSSTNVLGASPAQAMGMVYQTTAHSISLLMQNAVTTQNSMQQVNAAVISTACRQIMSLPSQIMSKPNLTNGTNGSADRGDDKEPSQDRLLPEKKIDTEEDGGQPEEDKKEDKVRFDSDTSLIRNELPEDED